VRVGIQGDANAGVAQSLGHHLWMDSLEQHQGGVAVAEVVEPDRGETLEPAEPVPPRGQGPRVHRAPVPPVHHQVPVLPGFGGTSTVCLLPTVGTEEGPEERREGNGAPAPLRLGLSEQKLASDHLEASADMGNGQTGVEIGPPQAQDFSPSHSGGDGHGHREGEPGPLDIPEEPGHQGGIGDHRLGAARPWGLGRHGGVSG